MEDSGSSFEELTQGALGRNDATKKAPKTGLEEEVPGGPQIHQSL